MKGLGFFSANYSLQFVVYECVCSGVFSLFIFQPDVNGYNLFQTCVCACLNSSSGGYQTERISKVVQCILLSIDL